MRATEAREAASVRLDAGLVAAHRPRLVPILEGQAGSAWSPDRMAACRDGFVTRRCLELPRLLVGSDTELVAGYYHDLIRAGWLAHVSAPERWVIDDDPVGQALHRRFRPLVEAAAGRPLRPSYCYATEYLPGAALHMHIDRMACEFTISLMLDYDPLPADGRSPWPLVFETEAAGGMELVRFHQAPGDAVLFKGRALRHGRPATLGQERCLVVMLHYVEMDFPDALMDVL